MRLPTSTAGITLGRRSWQGPTAFTRRTRGAAAPTSYQLVADGNSLPDGFLATVGDDPISILHRRLMSGFGRDLFTVNNFAVTGEDTDNMAAQAATVDAEYDATGVNVCVLWEHVNQRVITESSLADCKSKFRAVAQNHRTVGWYVVPITMSATGWATEGLGQKFEDWENTERDEIDDDLQDGAAVGVYWDAIADLSADATVAEQIQDSSATADFPENFITDGGSTIHMTGFGYGYATRVVFPEACDGFGLTLTATQLGIAGKLVTFFPFYKVAAETSPDNPTLDSAGGNQLIPSGTWTQNDLSISKGGTDAKIARTTHTMHVKASGFCFFGWLKASAWPAQTFGEIASVYDKDNNAEWLLQWYASRGTLSLYYSPTGSTAFVGDFDGVLPHVDSTVSAAVDTWLFVELGHDGADWYITVNDETPVTATAAAVATGTKFQIGDEIGGRNVQGEWRGWGYCDAPLTTAERTYLYNGGTPRDTLFTAPV